MYLSRYPCSDDIPTDGAWIQDHQLPSGKSRYGVFDQLEERNNLVVQRTLNNPTKLTNAADVQVPDFAYFLFHSRTNLRANTQPRG